VPEKIYAFLINLFFHAPTLMICLAGMLIARVQLRQNSRVARLTFTALLLLFITAIVPGLYSSWLPRYLHEERMLSMQQIAIIQSFIGILIEFARAAGIGLLIAAVVVDRSVGPSKTIDPEIQGDQPAPRPSGRVGTVQTSLAVALLIGGIGQFAIGLSVTPRIPELGTRIGVLGMLWGISGLLFLLAAITARRRG
jgi:hypothetical protein